MHRIILDTDPGIDDALALFLALASPEIQLEAITTVSGNVSVDRTTRNALALLELTGRTEIPVARGSARPLVCPPVLADYVHGDNGLGGVELPEPRLQPVAQHAVEVIIEKVMGAAGDITLVTLGPLTNIALALRREPRIVQQVREVVIMGGALRVPGNVTPAAEFNIFVDPHAAHMVVHAGWPIRLVSLDVTMQAQLNREQVNRLASSGSPVLRVLKQMLDSYFENFAAKVDTKVFHMHDPLCVAAALYPDLISWQPAYVDIELAGSLTLGETVAYFARSEATVDPRQQLPPPNIQAAIGVDAERFIALYVDRVGQAFR
jgi:purine nucleosidase